MTFAQSLHTLIRIFAVMKLLSLILSIYILALNFSPCEDNRVLNDEVKIEISEQSSDDHTDLDLCSPFCQCHCCHVHATDFDLTDLLGIATEISTEIFFSPYGLEKNYYYTILQPPRV